MDLLRLALHPSLKVEYNIAEGKITGKTPLSGFAETAYLADYDVDSQDVGILSEVNAPDAPHVCDIGITPKKSIPIHTGLHVIIGHTSAGKTTLIEHMANQCTALQINHVFIPWGEPRVDSLVTYSGFYDALAAHFAAKTPVIFVDGLRKMVYSETGGTGRRGISMGIFDSLTALDVAAQQLGLAIIVTLNPLLIDSEALKEYATFIQGSVTSVSHLTDPGKLRLSHRSAGGSQRAFVDIPYTLSDLGKGTKKNSLATAKRELVLESAAKQSVLFPAIPQALRS